MSRFCRTLRPAYRAPVKHTPHTPTDFSRIEESLKTLHQNRLGWASMQASEKAKILEHCLGNIVDISDEWVQKTVQVKGSYENGEGEETMALSSIALMTRDYVTCLKANYKPAIPKVRHNKERDQVVCEVFPTGLLRLAFLGMKGEVWVKRGEGLTQGLAPDVLDGSTPPPVFLILGAGNQAPAVVGDILHCLCTQNGVGILKMNPVNDFLGPVIEKAFKPLVDKGVLQIVYGGGETGAFLCNHDLVTEVHMTGSADTFNAIKWKGKPPRPSAGATIPKATFEKPLYGELGCITPYIIVPGDWSDSDIDSKARQCVSAKVHNAGHNCIALEVLVVPKGWHLREKFMDRIRHYLSKCENRSAWYPGSRKRYDDFLQRFSGC
mmetsp:Transcript_7140/g.18246  ORF Transcript_7140/g.18246 Transcript_7140/m.18246 type:complete len:380 (+) Transcript_7140:124-1263(+)